MQNKALKKMKTNVLLLALSCLPSTFHVKEVSFIRFIHFNQTKLDGVMSLAGDYITTNKIQIIHEESHTLV